MSTRSYIGIVNGNGTVRAIYHHWDGYLEGVGKILIDYYKDEERVNKLLDLGDMSSIGIDPIGGWEECPENYCRTYRERGEKGTDARTYNSIDDYLEKCDEDYTYLFYKGEWLYRIWNSKELRFVEKDLERK